MRVPRMFLLFLVLAGAAVAATHLLAVRFTAGTEPPPGVSREFLFPREREAHLSREQKNGKALYEYYCSLCHGKTGNADGFNAFNLKTPPTRHTDSILMGTLSDAQIREIIRKGGAALGRSPQMPPWRNVLSDLEIAHIASYIRSLSVPDPSGEDTGRGKDAVGKETGSSDK